jgi:AbrB family looped-hinge helix DNA binding protein
MAKKKRASCIEPTAEGVSCCKVESLISVDDRGQMVLPKEIRDKAGIRPGDKLALVSWEKNGKICCINLIKAEDFADMVRGVLGPIMKEMVETPPVP